MCCYAHWTNLVLTASLHLGTSTDPILLCAYNFHDFVPYLLGAYQMSAQAKVTAYAAETAACLSWYCQANLHLECTPLLVTAIGQKTKLNKPVMRDIIQMRKPIVS